MELTLVPLSEHLCEVNRLVDRFLPCFRFKDKVGFSPLVHGWKLKEIACHDQLDTNGGGALAGASGSSCQTHLYASKGLSLFSQFLSDSVQLIEQFSINHRH